MSPHNQGGWEPLPPSGEYDPEATGFLQLPPEGWDSQSAGYPDPLAAPGHGYTPPPIAAASSDPAETTAFRIPDFSTPPDAEHTGTWQIAGGPASHPADGEGSRDEGQISAWTKVDDSPASADEGAAMRRGLSAGLTASAAPSSEPSPEPSPEPVPDESDTAEQWTAPAPAPDPGLPDEHPRASYVLRVNEADRPVTDAWIGESLLYVLRERLGLAGAKDGCSQGECGACNVKVDGRLVASCLVPAATAAGAEIRTAEGLAADGLPSDVQAALAASGAVQCGFCVPGIAMTVHDLLEGNHTPSERETRQALCGNLCRCTGYQGVLSAVQDVIARRTGGATEDPYTPGAQEGGPA
ncbi:hypothetical protein SRB5_59590 [Streptomyces sp. RB5]|uniref:2Fe-2S ferredoxin-type domain-containing protein n=1 Tax=Streptomyces smaragdinus TaxID=2585196 RepID=A0A7K0CQK0_9ACTN|nr:(2Fe-2S)-binding protein [Streptomyces smaragdinus]MQY15768.1 hypothetical protein [Streptomyces smaragdinus]